MTFVKIKVFPKSPKFMYYTIKLLQHLKSGNYKLIYIKSQFLCIFTEKFYFLRTWVIFWEPKNYKNKTKTKILIFSFSYNLIKMYIIRYLYPIRTVLSIWTLLLSLKVTYFIDTWRYMSVKKSNWKDNFGWKVQKRALSVFLKERCFRGVLIIIAGKFTSL